MRYRAVVDKQSCQSSGRCLDAEPRVFAQDGDHLAECRDGAPGLPLERLQEIARGCPALAIQIVDAGGREVDPF